MTQAQCDIFILLGHIIAGINDIFILLGHNIAGINDRTE